MTSSPPEIEGSKRWNQSISDNKNNWPNWLKEIKIVELLAIGLEIGCRNYPINGLLLNKNRLPEHIYKLIDSAKLPSEGVEDVTINNVVLTSDKLEVVALLDGLCFVAKPDFEVKDVGLEKINWPTAFFASLAYEMLEKDWKNDQEKRIERAMRMSTVVLMYLMSCAAAYPWSQAENT